MNIQFLSQEFVVKPSGNYDFILESLSIIIYTKKPLEGALDL